MVFLNPGVLWLLPLAALPLLSLVLRPRRGRTVAWGAGRFLAESAAATRRWRLRRVLRALLGLAVLLCLVLGASRPLVWPGGGWWWGGAPEAVVIGLDRSPAQEALGADGRAQRSAVLDAMQARWLPLAEGSRLLVADAERGTTRRVDGGRLGAYPGLGALDVPTDLPRLLALALDRVAADAVGTAEIWLGTGDQRSAWQPEHPAWAGVRQRLDREHERFRVRWFRPPASRRANLSLRVAGSGRDEAVGAAWVRLAIRGRSSQPIALTLRANGVESAFTIPPWSGDALVQEVPVKAVGDAAVVGDVCLPDDANPADNTGYFALGARRSLRALIACSDPAQAQVAAAAVAPDPADPWREARMVDLETIGAEHVNDVSLVVVERLPQAVAARAALQAFVESGGMVFLLPEQGGTRVTWLGVTREPRAAAESPVQAVVAGGPARPHVRADGTASASQAELGFTGRPEESQAGLGPTAEPGGLRGVGGLDDLCQGLPLEHLAARAACELRGGAVLARWDDGRPLLVGSAAGRGAAVWCAAPLDPETANLADGVVLVPLLQRLLAAGARRLDPVERRDCGLLPPDPARRCVLPSGADADRSAGLKAGILRTQPAGGGLETTLVLERAASCDDTAVVSVAEVRGLIGAALVEDSSTAAAAPREGSAALLYAALVLLGLDLLLAIGRPSWISASRSGWRRASGRERLALGLRAVGMVLALVMAWRPERIVTTASRSGLALLLLDGSGSMQAPDADMASSTRAAAAQRLSQALRARLEPRGPVDEMSFGVSAVAGGGTDLHAALTGALARWPAAVVLFSDGAWNAGADPGAAALAAAAAGVPVFAVCLGRSEPLPNLRLAEASVPERVALGDTVAVGAKVVNALPESWSGEIGLSEAGTRVAVRQVTLPAGSEGWASLRWRAQTPGNVTLTLAVPVPPGDTLPADNLRTMVVQVEREPRRVLFVDGRARWEFRAALLALRADPAVQVQTLLLEAARPRDAELPPDLQGEDAAADDSSRDRLAEFPGWEALQDYDAVILGAVRFGVGEGALPAQAAADLARGVEVAGLGLILLPGHGAGPTVWAQGPLRAVLPVGPAAADEQVRTRTAFQPRVTAEAQGSGLLALGASSAEDAGVWQGLPGLRRYSRCGLALPGSSVLAALPEEARESLSVPLVVFRRTGLGRVLYVGSDDLWRWRAAAGEPHARFWRGAVRAVARRATKAEGSAWRVLVEGSPAVVGAPVIVHAVPVAESVDTAAMALGCTLRSPQGTVVRMRLDAGAAAGAVLTGRTALPEAGRWEVLLEGETTAVATVEVRAGMQEDATAVARPEVLDALAAVSGGRRYAADQIAALAAAVEARRGALAETRRLRLWAQPACVSAAVLLLGLGWVLRGRGA
jgi:hypothetical protein